MTHEFEPDALLAQAGWLKGLARGLVLDEARADDVVQQTWLRAIERPPREPQALPAWLAAVARNEARQAGRSEGARTRRQKRVARPEASVPATSDVVARAELHEQLVRRVLALPEPQRSALLLRYFEGLPPSEIARREDVSAGTVRSRLKRGLDSLRADLDRECGGDRRAWVAALLPWAGSPRAGTTAVGAGGAAGTMGVLAMGAKTKTIAIALAILAFGGLLGWSLLGNPEDGGGGGGIGDGGDGQPVLRGRADAGEAPDVAVREAAESPAVQGAEAPPRPRVALAFVDEEGRPWTADELRERYAAEGLPPRLTFVRQSRLADGGIAGLLATLFGPADTWQETVDLEWTADGAAALPSASGDWRVFLARPGAAPYLSDPRALAAGETAALEIPFPRHPRRIRVRLLDATTGLPLGGATVTPYHEYGDDQAFLRGPSVVADAAGEVALPVYDDQLSGRSRGSTWWIETPTHGCALSNFDLGSRDAGVVLEWPVHPTAAVGGRAWTSDGAPATGREVLWARKGCVRRAVVAKDGSYALAGIPMKDRPARSERLFLLEDPARGVMTATSVELRAGETTEADLGKPASPNAATLVGRITAGERPLAGVFVSAKTWNGPGKGSLAQTDADGGYRIAGLQEGPTEIRMYFGDPRVVDDFSARSTEPLPLAAGTETRLDLALPEGAILLKLVRDDDDAPIAGGVGAAWPMDREVEAGRFDGFRYGAGWGGRTDEDGTILLLALVPGQPHALEAGGDGYEKVTQEDVQPGTLSEPALVTVRLKPSGGG